jgi:membrane-bound serine protease (ClpP class)
MDSTTWLIALLLVGTILIGVEIFIPGAVAGTIGGAALIVAVIVAFDISPTCGFYVLFGVFILVTLTTLAWIKLFPKSGIGQKMTLSIDGKGFKAPDPHQALLGKTGVTQSELRPAGYAVIDGKRIDVVSEGGIVDAQTSIKVIKVEGTRVVVRRIES